MNVVLNATQTMEQLCGEQSDAVDASWRMTAHCLRVPCDDGILLYHTMTGCLLHLTDAEAAAMETDAAFRCELAARWFLVPSDFDERKHARDVREILRLMNGEIKQVTHFTVLTTTACNARCAYCFEQDAPIKTMDEATAKRVAAYIADACGGKKVSFSWFGGEPLCNIPAIRTICAGLKDRGVDFDGIMTSNGYYLTPDIAREARNFWHLDRVQITLDGTKDVYERIKNYAGEINEAFERVLDNIEGALDADIHVTIRLNMDRKNADDLATLLDQLGRRFSSRSNCSVTVQPLRAFTVAIDEFDSDEEKDRAFSRLAEKTAAFGMVEPRTLNRSLPLNRCKADNDGCEVIMPDGCIGKCDHCLNGPYIGHIDRPERDKALIAAWKAEQPEFTACADCPLYPSCIRTAGCAWLKDGCDDFARRHRIKKMCNDVRNTFKKWQEGQMKDGIGNET